MINVFLVIQIIISFFLIGVILLQKDSTDGLSGLSGSSGALGGVLNAKAADNILIKITKYLAILFLVNSLILCNLATRLGKSSSIIDKIDHHHEIPKTVPVGE